MCCSTTPGHRDCPGMWLMVPVRLYWTTAILLLEKALIVNIILGWDFQFLFSVLGYLSDLNLCGLVHTVIVSEFICVLILLCLFFPPTFSKNLSFTFFAFTFSPGLSTLCCALPLSGPDSFQQVLKGNCNSFHLKNMYNCITQRTGWNWKCGSSCSCRGPRFHSPAPHTYASSDSQ